MITLCFIIVWGGALMLLLGPFLKFFDNVLTGIEEQKEADKETWKDKWWYWEPATKKGGKKC